MRRHDEAQPALRVTPPLTPQEGHLVSSLAGADRALSRIWRGQPRLLSPWSPCDQGCCLVLGKCRDEDASLWLRFLLAEVLAPASGAATARAAALGAPGGHVVDGRLTVGLRQLVVASNSVRFIAAPRARSDVPSRHQDPLRPGTSSDP